jgi:DNA sulfur modification protein DndB
MSANQNQNTLEPIKLPTLRGKMGDWFYYVTLLTLKELSSRTSLVPDIHKNKELSRWIQREVSNRCEDIVLYLKEQPQRFFNSVICGIYGGKPQWQELDIRNGSTKLREEERDYLGKTFGILSLSGEEKIFAIDGQHRINAIKLYLQKSNEIADEEIAVIFVAHKNTKEGEVRTRRLFSTLNRYAAPVNISEIIALDEEDNCAILTRWLMEDFVFFNEKIQFSKTRSMNKNNREHFSNIVLLYDMVTIILTDKSFSKNIQLPGFELKKFTSRRQTEDVLNAEFEKLKLYFGKVFNSIPSIRNYFETGLVDRSSNATSLLFRPIGQMILFYVLKISKENSKEKKAINYFAKDSFNLNNKVWKKVFIDPEKRTLKTDKPRQLLAIQLICKNIGIDLTMTKAEQELMNNFRVNVSDI